MILRLAVLTIAASLGSQVVWAQAYKAPRAGDGHADLQGIWQARNAAAGSLEAHSASWGIRAGASVVVDPADGKIPYKPEMLAQRDANYKTRATADPVNKCFLPGVPRVMYLPYPIQIFQTPAQISITSEFAHAVRHVYVTNKGHYGEAEFWMGDSRAKWDGDTLVIDSIGFNGKTRLDTIGHGHSDQLHVIQKLSPKDATHFNYEVTVDDPKMYSKPWTNTRVYTRMKPGDELIEYSCEENNKDYTSGHIK